MVMLRTAGGRSRKVLYLQKSRNSKMKQNSQNPKQDGNQNQIKTRTRREQWLQADSRESRNPSAWDMRWKWSRAVEPQPETKGAKDKQSRKSKEARRQPDGKRADRSVSGWRSPGTDDTGTKETVERHTHLLTTVKHGGGSKHSIKSQIYISDIIVKVWNLQKAEDK